MLRKQSVFVLLFAVLLLAAFKEGAAMIADEAPGISSVNSVETSPLVAGSDIRISGDLERRLHTDFDIVQAMSAESAGAEGLMLYLNQGTDYVVFIQFPKDAQPGTYSLSDEAFDGTNLTGMYLESADPLLMFTITEGALTLEKVGRRFSGSFEFTAEGGVAQTVRAVGSFSDIRLEA